MQPEEPPAKANWVSFVLYYIIGIISGLILGFCIIRRRRRGIWLNEELILPFLIGAALISAGIFAKMGDRLLLDNHYKLIPPDNSSHSKLSLSLSILSIVIGAGLVSYSLCRHFGG